MAKDTPQDKPDDSPIKNPLERDKNSDPASDQLSRLIDSVDMKNWSEVTSGYFHSNPIKLGPILGNPSLWNKSQNPLEQEPLKATESPKQSPTELPPLQIRSGDSSLPAPGTEVDLKHSSGVTETTDDLLCEKPVDSYNCVYYAKTYIEDAPPLSLNPTMEGLPDSKYMRKNGFELVKTQDFKEGDVIFISIPHSGHLTPDVHACIVTKVDAHHNILKTRQKPDPTHPVQDMNMEQMSVNYFGGVSLDDLRRNHLAGVWRKSA